MLSYLSPDIICFKKRIVFREHSSRKAVSFEEQIMSKDKYLSKFSPQMEAIVFIILQMFFATHAVLKIGVCSRILPSFSWLTFSHMTCLDQLHASKYISWIINVLIPCHRKKKPTNQNAGNLLNNCQYSTESSHRSVQFNCITPNLPIWLLYFLRHGIK